MLLVILALIGIVFAIVLGPLVLFFLAGAFGLLLIVYSIKSLGSNFGRMRDDMGKIRGSVDVPTSDDVQETQRRGRRRDTGVRRPGAPGYVRDA